MTTKAAGAKPAREPEEKETVHELDPWTEPQLREWLASRWGPEEEKR